MSIYLNEEKLKRCPFDRSHKISEGRYKFHVKKCTSENRKLYVQCKYNAGHWIMPEEMEEHLRSCGDFLLAVQQVKNYVFNGGSGDDIPGGVDGPLNLYGPGGPLHGRQNGLSRNSSPAFQQLPELDYPTTPPRTPTSTVSEGGGASPSQAFFTPPSSGKSFSPEPNSREMHDYRNSTPTNRNDEYYGGSGGGREPDNYYNRKNYSANANRSQMPPSYGPSSSSNMNGGGPQYSYKNGGGGSSPQINKMVNMVIPGFNLLKPVDWASLRRRETFEPLTKFQLQTLTKGQRQTYHRLLMDWQKWKNSIDGSFGGAASGGGNGSANESFDY